MADQRAASDIDSLPDPVQTRATTPMTTTPMTTTAATAAADLEDLIACPQCDALYRAVQPKAGETATCTRCHAVLIAPRAKAGMQIIVLAVTILVLIGGALFFPFLNISRMGFGNSASLVDSALAFADGWQVLLAVSVLAFIVLIPMGRALLLLYVLVPIVFDRPPAPRAGPAFRLSEAMRPWSMAEIFALGCAVSLVKVADLATIGFGPAFWMFTGVVLIQILMDTRLCRWSVWDAISEGERIRREGDAPGPTPTPPAGDRTDTSADHPDPQAPDAPAPGSRGATA